LPKPWAKYEIGFLRHAKFLALTSNAICLWLEAKSYCDEHLTDGMFPRVALRTFRFNGAKSVESLMTSCGLKPNGDAYAPLWEAVDIGGVPYVRMHDFLVHNDCREVALKRIAQVEARRDADRDRKAAARSARQSAACPQESPHGSPHGHPAEIRRESASIQNQNQNQNQAAKEQPLSLARERTHDVGDRAADLLENYPRWFAEERHGARIALLGGPMQFAEAQKLCEVWESDARLEKLARIVLTTEDPWISGTDRGWKIFVLKASWADDRLRQWEQVNQVVA
jgi:hypothetical protein